MIGWRLGSLLMEGRRRGKRSVDWQASKRAVTVSNREECDWKPAARMEEWPEERNVRRGRLRRAFAEALIFCGAARPKPVPDEG